MDQTASSAQAFLLDLESSRKIPIVCPECRVGRDDQNDIVLGDDTSISRFHVVITCQDGKYIVKDEGSRNGTFLNGNRLSKPEPINDGDALKIGASLFWFVVETDLVPAMSYQDRTVVGEPRPDAMTTEFSVTSETELMTMDDRET
jgi:pSer/pThr/pTyr-binding forkhead associated (FHA) protein